MRYRQRVSSSQYTGPSRRRLDIADSRYNMSGRGGGQEDDAAPLRFRSKTHHHLPCHHHLFTTLGEASALIKILMRRWRDVMRVAADAGWQGEEATSMPTCRRRRRRHAVLNGNKEPSGGCVSIASGSAIWFYWLLAWRSLLLKIMEVLAILIHTYIWESFTFYFGTIC